MKVLRFLARAVVGFVVLLATLYMTAGICVAFFLLTGQIEAGERMFFEMRAPHGPELLAYLAICAVILAIGLALLGKLRSPSGPKK